MFKKFILKNYRNFKDEICIDFENIADYQFSADCIAGGLISKMLIYGRNATGKTNLGHAIMDIAATVCGKLLHKSGEAFLNADSMEDAAIFSYVFQFNNEEVIYQYSRLSYEELQTEKLIIDGTDIFTCDFIAGTYNFDNLRYIDAETANTERYLQSIGVEEETEASSEFRIPFLRWLLSNVALKKESALIQLASYVNRMMMITVRNSSTTYSLDKSSKKLEVLLESQERLQELEEFLNEMGVTCKLTLKKLPDGQNKLYFSHEKLVPFYETASSGTLILTNLYRRIICRPWDLSFIYFDEFDAFYHYEMAENLVKFFKKRYSKCQVIMTTHNTNLMSNRLMRPDCLFILSETGTLTALCNATSRELREGHNLEKMYISREFERYE